MKSHKKTNHLPLHRKPLLPAWLSVEGAVTYSGLSRSLIYEYLSADLLVNSSVRRPGKTRGRRLINRASLDALIEAGVQGGSTSNN